MITEKACEERRQNDREVLLHFSASLEFGSSSIYVEMFHLIPLGHHLRCSGI